MRFLFHYYHNRRTAHLLSQYLFEQGFRSDTDVTALVPKFKKFVYRLSKDNTIMNTGLGFESSQI
ncbi:hypothetical protein BpHYR1_051244 [Brachionus plicatilis]|uniref:Uncharacterized protein n=1 Tax=Brachionus plicatilis TaxID=10195 RepID=A0A3M7QY00_BRAPC|nr:hypothetical protein BpHYR1_051244 [Brachionus plicatilis]